MKTTWRICILFGVILGSMLVFAPLASAHYPVLVASLACDGTVSYTVNADIQGLSRNNPNVAVTDTSDAAQPVATGVFTPENHWSFSGSYTLPTSVTSVTLTATALGVWGDGYFNPAEIASAEVTRPTDCEVTSPPTPAAAPTPVAAPVPTAAPVPAAVPAPTAAPAPAPAATPTPQAATPTPSVPGIALSKSPKTQTIASGSTATFTIVVTNTGNVTLTNVSVADAVSPACAATSSTIPALASLAAGASVTYTCTVAGVSAGFTNVATDTGTPPSGPDITGSDTAVVSVTPAPFTPPTAIVKRGVVKHPSTSTGPFTPPNVTSAPKSGITTETQTRKPRVVAHRAPKTAG